MKAIRFIIFLGTVAWSVLPAMSQQGDDKEQLYVCLVSGAPAYSEDDRMKDVKAILERGKVDINSLPSLMLAAGTGSTRLVEMLLKYGADLEMCNRDGENAMRVAARHGDIAMVRFLLSQGASHVSRKGWTSLGAAAWGNKMDMVLFLLEHGADVRKSGWEPLGCACKNGNLEMAKLLLDRGADAFVRSVAFCPTSGTMIHWAARGGNLEVVKLIVSRGGDPLSLTGCGETALMCACESGNLDVVRYFIEQGVDINHICGKMQCNRSALIWAVYSHEKNCRTHEIVAYLLEQGANKSVKDVAGKTALDYAQEGLRQMRLVEEDEKGVTVKDSETLETVSKQYVRWRKQIDRMLKRGADSSKIAKIRKNLKLCSIKRSLIRKRDRANDLEIVIALLEGKIPAKDIVEKAARKKSNSSPSPRARRVSK